MIFDKRILLVIIIAVLLSVVATGLFLYTSSQPPKTPKPIIPIDTSIQDTIKNTFPDNLPTLGNNQNQLPESISSSNSQVQSISSNVRTQFSEPSQSDTESLDSKRNSTNPTINKDINKETSQSSTASKVNSNDSTKTIPNITSSNLDGLRLGSESGTQQELDNARKLIAEEESKNIGITTTQENSQKLQSPSTIPSPSNPTESNLSISIGDNSIKLDPSDKLNYNSQIDSLTKYTFTNGEKLLITPSVIPEARILDFIPKEELRYPAVGGNLFYIMRDAKIYFLGEGILGVYELKTSDKIYNLVVTNDINGYTKLFGLTADFTYPQRINIELGKFEIGNITRKNGNIFGIQGVNGQRDFETKEFELDLFKEVDSRLSPNG